MPFSLGLSPQGHFIEDDQAEEILTFAARDEEAVKEAVLKGNAAVLLWLAAQPEIETLPISALYWRGIAGMYLTLYCRQGGVAMMENKPATAEWGQLVQDAPPMKGGEYLTASVLESMWDGLHQAVQFHVSKSPQWLAETLPHWRMVGRVTLHLAENRKSLERPFAFLATYVHGLNAEGTPRHLPLQQAIKEYAGRENRSALLKLLEPLSLAAEKSEWMRDMVDGGHIYKAQGWTPGQALIFLHQIALFEASGLSVRIPDWWKAASPTRPKVAVEMDGGVNADAGFNIGSLMKFDIAVSLEGEKLTPEELEALKTAEGLVLVKGKWVEVDSEKLQAVLKHWQHARAMQFQGGMSFLQAMRLLSGMPEMGNETAGNLSQDVVREWSSVTPGPGLQNILANMRDPSQLQELTQHPDLKAQLRPYQAIGVNWLRFMTRLGLGACLADDMGLGKTVQVLALLLAVKRMEPESGPSLLVAPASLLQNWAAEVEKFAPSLRLFIAHSSGGDKDQKMLTKLSQGKLSCLDKVDLVITSYAMLTRLKVLSEFHWRLFIVDEAQYIKNADSVQSKTVRRVQAAAKIALTGTPVENRLGDLWALFDLINPGLLGNAAAFKRFIKSLSKDGAAHYTPLRRLVRPYILRRLKTDKSIIQDLPDKTELTAWCMLTKPQAILYQRAVQTLIKTLSEVDKDARRGVVLSALLTFKQICNHPAQHSGDSHYDVMQSGKFLRLQELCVAMAERQEKVLIFTQFTQIIPALRSLLRSVFNRDGLVLTGSTPVKERQQLVKTFQSEGGPPFFILSLKAGGTGLTLTAASHVIHFDRWWNPAVENQATDRAYRIGQKKNVLVHKFVCRGTLEEKIDRLIGEKSKLAGSILQTGEDEIPLTEMSDEELIELVSMDMNQTMEKGGD